MPENQHDGNLLAEVRDIALRQLAATQELLEVQKCVSARYKKALRLVTWIFVPLAAALVAYIGYALWWNINAGAQ